VIDVKIGQISVALHEPPANMGQVSCGHVVCDVGYAAAYRFYTELTKIREALATARAVLTARGSAGETSPAEMHLARLLVELEVHS
jgi:glucokinase